MESSPVRRVRQRTDPGPGNVTTNAGREDTALLTPPQHARVNHSAGEEQHCFWGKWNRPAMIDSIKMNKNTPRIRRRRLRPTMRGMLRHSCGGPKGGSGARQNLLHGQRGLLHSFRGELCVHQGGHSELEDEADLWPQNRLPPKPRPVQPKLSPVRRNMGETRKWRIR